MVTGKSNARTLPDLTSRCSGRALIGFANKVEKSVEAPCLVLRTHLLVVQVQSPTWLHLKLSGLKHQARTLNPKSSTLNPKN